MSKKIIFITGVTSGVGRETARRFIKEGWKVIGTGRRQSRLVMRGAITPPPAA